MTTNELWITIIVLGIIITTVVGEIIDSIMAGKSEKRRRNYLQGLNNDSGIIDKKKARKEFNRSKKRK